MPVDALRKVFAWVPASPAVAALLIGFSMALVMYHVMSCYALAELESRLGNSGAIVEMARSIEGAAGSTQGLGPCPDNDTEGFSKRHRLPDVRPMETETSLHECIRAISARLLVGSREAQNNYRPAILPIFLDLASDGAATKLVKGFDMTGCGGESESPDECKAMLIRNLDDAKSDDNVKGAWVFASLVIGPFQLALWIVAFSIVSCWMFLRKRHYSRTLETMYLWLLSTPIKLGLLGTIYGLILALMAMGAATNDTSSTDFSEVFSGMAVAFATTGLGLFVALASSILEAFRTSESQR